MSNYYSSYNQYLGAQRCCNIKSQGPVGPKGPVGPASIGPIGNTGPTGKGNAGDTGPTGLKGEKGDNSGYTGQTGATGSPGVVVQYKFKTSFTDSSNTLKYAPSTDAPYANLSTLLCYDAGSLNNFEILAYEKSIIPQSTDSNIKVQFKIQYQASDTEACLLYTSPSPRD